LPQGAGNGWLPRGDLGGAVSSWKGRRSLRRERHRVLVFIAAFIVREHARIRNEELLKVASRLDELGNGLAVNGALKFFVEIGEAIWSLLVCLEPALSYGTKTTIDQLRLRDSFDASALFAAVLLLI